MEPTTTPNEAAVTSGALASDSSALPDAAISADGVVESAANAVEAGVNTAVGLDAASADAVLMQLSELSVYLMGASFIAGSLFTVLMLLILDFMRRNKTEEGSK